MHLKTLMLTATACASALLTALPAQAQDNQLGEIIVTARKRQESILNVPVIETAIPQAKLERFQTQDLNDIAKQVPGLSLGEAVLSIGTQVSLRGVGTNTLDAGVDQSVSLNLDGLQLSNGLAYSAGLFDIGQVEVLKGPQALFYGKNSPGGVIAMRTADPTDRFEVIARGGYEFEARQRQGDLIVSGPVSDTLKLRLAGRYLKEDGFFKNEAIADPGTGALPPENRRSAEVKSYIVRGTALWNPTDAVSARVKLNLVHDNSPEGGAEQMVSCPDGVGPVVPFANIPFLGGGEDCKKNRVLRVVNLDPNAFPGIKNGGRPFIESDQHFGTIELNFRLQPGLTLTSTTGYYWLKSSSLINGTQTTFAATPLAAENDFHRNDFTEELRLNSDWVDSPINFTAGGYYQNANFSNQITLLGNQALGLGLPVFLAHGTHDVAVESASVFGQLRWKIIDTLEIAAGARWTDEWRNDAPVNLVTGRLVALAEPKIDSHNLSPELTLTYTPLDTLTVFGSLKKGYKSGSFTVTTPAADGIDNSFGDEKVQGGEVGVKSRLLDRHLALNVAAYDYKYTGLQVGANEIAQSGLPVVHTINAGGAKVYGVDFDATYNVPQVNGLSLTGAVNWNHARFTKLNNVPCWGGQMISEGCDQVLNPATGLFTSQDLKGAPLVRAPNWQANFGFNYEMPVGDGMKVILASNNQYSGRYTTILGDRADFFQKSFIKADLSLTLQGKDDRWELSLIGKNLNNAYSAGNCVNLNAANGQILGGEITGGVGRGPAGIDEVTCFVDPGRELWIRATFRPFSK
jgi:iron complex outermembrane receptor protein